MKIIFLIISLMSVIRLEQKIFRYYVNISIENIVSFYKIYSKFLVLAFTYFLF